MDSRLMYLNISQPCQYPTSECANNVQNQKLANYREIRMQVSTFVHMCECQLLIYVICMNFSYFCSHKSLDKCKYLGMHVIM